MVNLKFKYKDYYFDLTFRNRLTSVTGNSGSGKSFITFAAQATNTVRLYPSQPLYIHTDYDDPQARYAGFEALEAIKKCKPGLYLIDEDILYNVPSMLQDTLTLLNSDADVTVVLVCRTAMDHVVHGVHNTVELWRDGNTYTLRLVFDRSLLKKKLAGTDILTEDSRSSFLVYRELYGETCVHTSHGRTSFLKTLLHLLSVDDSRVVIGILDLCGISGVMQDLSMISKKCYLVNCLSFEELVLHSQQLFPNYTVQSVNNVYNLEQFYEDELKVQLMKFYKIQYSKSNKDVMRFFASGRYTHKGSDGFRTVTIHKYTRDWDPVIIKKSDPLTSGFSAMSLD